VSPRMVRVSPALGPPKASQDPNFSAVSCANIQMCLAVGSQGYYLPLHSPVKSRPLTIGQYSQGVWHLRTLPNIRYWPTTAAELAGISCPGPSGCFAVGFTVTGQWSRTLVMHFNGVKWSVMHSPSPDASASDLLSAIACPAVSECFAVGSTENRKLPLIEHFNGVSWSVVTLPTLAGSSRGQLLGVACPGVSQCYAVGVSSRRPLIGHYDGSMWRWIDLSETVVRNNVSIRSTRSTRKVFLAFKQAR
jgi:hypothetical protein